MELVRIMIRQRRSSKKRGGKAAIFADVSREPYYFLSFALDVSFVAFLAHPSPNNPFASKIPRKNSSYIAEFSGQKKNRTMRDVRKRMLKVQGFKLASHTVGCQQLSCQTFKYGTTAIPCESWKF